jgi:DNA sulfur modification protein DndE
LSQSPDDFDQEEDNFLENIGLAISFRTNATRLKTLRTILGADVDLSSLPAGVAVTRPAGKNSYVRVQAWEPS